MPLIVDTYNVLHQTGALPTDLAGIGLRGLVDLIESSRYRRRKVTLVCDGAPHGDAIKPASGMIRIVYTGAGRTADDHIVQIVRGSSSPRRVLVVTSDNAIIREVKRRDASTIGSEQFLRRLASDREKAEQAPAEPERPQGPLASKQVDEWTREFGINGASMDLDVTLPPHLQRRIAGRPKPQDPDQPERKTTDSPPRRDGPILPDDILAEAERLWQEGGGEDSEDET